MSGKCVYTTQVKSQLPLALIPESTDEELDDNDEDEDDDVDSEAEKANSEILEQQNANRAGKHKIKRTKLNKGARRLSTNNESRNQRVTRSMDKEQPRGEGAGNGAVAPSTVSCLRLSRSV